MHQLCVAAVCNAMVNESTVNRVVEVRHCKRDCNCSALSDLLQCSALLLSCVIDIFAMGFSNVTAWGQAIFNLSIFSSLKEGQLLLYIHVLHVLTEVDCTFT